MIKFSTLQFAYAMFKEAQFIFIYVYIHIIYKYSFLICMQKKVLIASYGI